MLSPLYLDPDLIYTVMVSFVEWMLSLEISSSGASLDVARPSARASGRLAPDPAASRVFGFVLRPRVMRAIGGYGAVVGGLPAVVDRVLGGMEGDVAMLSNAELAAFRDLVVGMRSAGFRPEAEELNRELDGAVETAVSRFPWGAP